MTSGKHVGCKWGVGGKEGEKEEAYSRLSIPEFSPLMAPWTANLLTASLVFILNEYLKYLKIVGLYFGQKLLTSYFSI